MRGVSVTLTDRRAATTGRVVPTRHERSRPESHDAILPRGLPMRDLPTTAWGASSTPTGVCRRDQSRVNHLDFI